MTLVKVYNLIETEAAIDRADRRNINSLKMVRNDVSTVDWGKTNIKVKNRNPAVSADLQFPGQKDEGHVFRHVDGTHEPDKSIYKDRQTAVAVTCEMLNSATGQVALQALQAENRTLYDNTTKRVTVTISGKYYGSRDNGATWERIETATCELLKLGDLLWVHSSYPRNFQCF